MVKKNLPRQWVQLDHEPAANFPMTLYYMGAQIASHRERGKYGPVVLVYQGRSVRECVAKNGFAGPGRKILARLKTDRHFLSWMWRQTRQRVNSFIKFSQAIERADLASWSKAKLVQTYDRWCHQALVILSYSTYGTVMEFEEPLLSGPLYEFLSQSAAPRYAYQTGDIFTILTTPIGQNENRQAEIELIKIVLRYYHALRKKHFDEACQLEIGKYHHRFSYLSYGYSGPKKPLQETVADFIAHARQSSLILRNKIVALQRADREVRQKQEQWFFRLRMDTEHRRLFKTLRDIGGLKRWRKKVMVHCQYLVHGLLEEISHRLRVPLLTVQSIAPWEMQTVLREKKFSSATLQTRTKLTVVWIDDHGWKVLPSVTAKKIMREIDASLKVVGTVNELHGMCACTGRAIGHVKILHNASDLPKFDAGDIIVSPATSPELVPAMRRAVAIVTDAGGITSHAAIVSRELSVPCVIGTKIATKVLKDGDKVEVDANKGIVRKIN